jgi:2'-5' RNA ligase
MTDVVKVRAFFALEIPEEIRDLIRREQRSLKAELPRARWTRPEGQHLTLKFLGEIPIRDATDLAGAVAARLRDTRTVAVRLAGSGFFPSPRRPRVAWVGGEAAGGAEVAGVVESAATAAGLAPERRPWSLHLTQARLDRPWPRPAVERFLDWGRGLELKPFTCAEVVLFRSELRPGGAVYTAIERIPLAR